MSLGPAQAHRDAARPGHPDQRLGPCRAAELSQTSGLAESVSENVERRPTEESPTTCDVALRKHLPEPGGGALPATTRLYPRPRRSGVPYTLEMKGEESQPPPQLPGSEPAPTPTRGSGTP